MTELTLRGCTILVVEDEYLLARDLCDALARDDVIVLGPAATVAQGSMLVQRADRLHGAILDVNLRGEPVFVLADMLVARNIPFMFTTGYDASIIPDRFSAVPRCEKPVRLVHILKTMGRIASETRP